MYWIQDLFWPFTNFPQSNLVTEKYLNKSLAFIIQMMTFLYRGQISNISLTSGVKDSEYINLKFNLQNFKQTSFHQFGQQSKQNQ